MKKTILGVSLLEMLLVLVVISTVIGLILNFVQRRADEIRRSRMAMEMQMILNAGIAYYLGNNYSWPITCGSQVNVAGSTLQTSGYLPSTFSGTNPWAQSYTIACDVATGGAVFSVSGNVTGATPAKAALEASVVAGRLPVASTSSATVTAQVLVPAEVLNNARSVNFAAIYHSGACVPVPDCLPGMTPSIFVAPASVTGVATSATDIYPISSYTGFAIGPGSSNSLGNCNGSGSSACQLTAGGTAPRNGQFWRICLAVITEAGMVAPSSTLQGQNMGTLVALTRCVPSQGEFTGSTLNVWAP